MDNLYNAEKFSANLYFDAANNTSYPSINTDWLIESSNGYTTIAKFSPQTLSLMCANGHISIDLATGVVSYPDNIDDAAKAFWDAVQKMYPKV